jgi:hypothetical protein
MFSAPKIAVVGCGIFGAMAAIRLAQNGFNVEIFERESGPLFGATLNNHNRLHLGFHYPRDIKTGRQCIDGLNGFQREFPECIRSGFQNAYFIASEHSKTSPSEYLSFCNQLGLKFETIDIESFKPRVNNVDLGILSFEPVYDCAVLRRLVLKRFAELGIKANFDCNIDRMTRDSGQYRIEAKNSKSQVWDAVVNCTYANQNHLLADLEIPLPRLQFELTAVPIFEWNRAPIGLTIMDGDFLTLQPYGLSRKFLLYHVTHSVLDRHIGTKMPCSWPLDRDDLAKNMKAKNVFEKMLEDSCEFIPDLADAEIVGFLHGPRVVLANTEQTDERPSFVQKHERGLYSIFSGKVDHCVTVSDSILKTLMSDFNYQTASLVAG